MIDQSGTVFWLAAIAFGIGVLGLIPIYLRGRRVRRGEVLPIDETDVIQRNFACGFILLGFTTGFGEIVMILSRVLPFAVFMTLCALFLVALLGICSRVDAAARRHR